MILGCLPFTSASILNVHFMTSLWFLKAVCKRMHDMDFTFIAEDEWKRIKTEDTDFVVLLISKNLLA